MKSEFGPTNTLDLDCEGRPPKKVDLKAVWLNSSRAIFPLAISWLFKLSDNVFFVSISIVTSCNLLVRFCPIVIPSNSRNMEECNLSLPSSSCSVKNLPPCPSPMARNVFGSVVWNLKDSL